MRKSPLLLLLVTCSCLGAFAQQKLAVGNIHIKGNRITKEAIILREIPFSIGDSLLPEDIPALVTAAKQNLTNTSLFNFITIEPTVLDSKYVYFDISVTERWYVWPGIIFEITETNFNSWWQNKDFDRINYGFSLQHYNFRGRREKLTLNFQYGWKRKAGFDYFVPGVDRKKIFGAGIELYYANNREINYTSVNNERIFLKLPHFLQEEISAIARFEIRRKYNNRHAFRVGFRTVNVSDTVTRVTEDYLANNQRKSSYLLFSYGFKREKRDNLAYPLKGYLIDGFLDQEGFGLFDKSDVMLTSAKFTFNTHHHIRGRWFFAHGAKLKYTIGGTPPYYFQKGLGYSNAFIRGYELYVMDGQHYFLYKSNIKYQLIKKKVVDLSLGFLNQFDKFHYSLFLNLFGDAGYVVDNIYENQNPLANSWQYGYGIGLDLVTYYDVVIRFEGSLNKQGVPAFYIHFKNPI